MCYNTKAVGNPASEYGLVAQLGERTVRIREVRGFDPLRVHQNKKQANGLFFCFARRGSNRHRTRRGRVHRPVRTSGRFLYFFFLSPAREKEMHATPLRVHHLNSHPKGWLFFCFGIRKPVGRTSGPRSVFLMHVSLPSSALLNISGQGLPCSVLEG